MLTKADIEKYFIAEKHESLVFLVIGIAVIVPGPDFLFYCENAGLPGRSTSPCLFLASCRLLPDTP